MDPVSIALYYIRMFGSGQMVGVLITPTGMILNSLMEHVLASITGTFISLLISHHLYASVFYQGFPENDILTEQSKIHGRIW